MHSVYINLVLLITIFYCYLVVSSDIISKPICPPLPANCTWESSALDEHFYNVDGEKIKIVFNGKHLELLCRGAVAPDHASLPRFEPTRALEAVQLSRCPPPRGSYAEALQQRGIILLQRLKLTLGGDTELREAHFRALNATSLDVSACAACKASAEPGFLRSAGPLRELWLERVALGPLGLARLPASLRVLRLKACAVGAFTRAEARRLPLLRWLWLDDEAAKEVAGLDAAPLLRVAYVSAPAARLADFHLLENVTVCNAERLPDELFGDCGQLRELTLTLSRWGAGVASGCAALESLRLQFAPVGEGGELPVGALRAARDLLRLDLSHDRLQALPGEAFANVKGLQELDVSFNRLDASALRGVAAMTSLQSLVLDRNPLGDFCDPRLGAWATQLRRLRRVSADGVGATQLCAELRTSPALRELSLRGNNISQLSCAELQFVRDGPSQLDLRGNPLRRLSCSEADFLQAQAPPERVSTAEVRVLLDSPLACDCGAYWFARLLRLSSFRARLRFPALRCADGRDLADVEPAELWCPAPPELCAPCECRRAPDGGLTALCAGRGLREAPPLPAEVRLLDLRNNSLRELPAQLLRERPALRLLLAGNPLSCACAPAERLSAGQLQAQVGDWASAACADGRALLEGASCAEGGGVRWAAGGAAASLALLLLGLALALAWAARSGRWPASRLHPKLKLLLLGRSAAEREDARCEYDAFLSFAHQDAAAAQQLLARLEAGGLRLCVHSRDWAAGAWIPAQIARSVRLSRRTVLLLSRSFARSHWARAEFRQAHAHALAAPLARQAPRLLVVLLDAAPPAGLDAELADFLRTNTYLAWSDPDFWRKLRAALPAPAPRRLS